MSKITRIIFVGILCLLVAAPAAMAAGKVVIKGSTTVLPVAQAAAEAYMKLHRDVNISLSGGGSGDGVKALIDKSTDIANSSREMKPKEMDMAKAKGVNPVAHIVAIDAIVPIVNPRNRVRNLSIDQLSQIYQGKITNWKEVGGKDGAIHLFTRDEASGTREVFWEKALKKGTIAANANVVPSNGAMKGAIAQDKDAIGYAGIGHVDQTVKGVVLDGVVASQDNAMNGSYPVVRKLYMNTKGEPSKLVKAFIDYILGPEGAKLIAKAGYLPLK